MTFKRWLPTFLAFPAGGLLAMTVVGSVDDPLTAAIGGLLAGAVIGAGQWLALGATKRWIAFTAVAMSAGSAVAAAITGAGTDLADLMIAGLITGAAVGAAQGTILAGAKTASRAVVTGAWTAITAASWSIAWLVTWLVVGVNTDEGFIVFGSSGALLATVITGLALRSSREVAA